MNDPRPEKLLGSRLLFAWAWLLATLLNDQLDPDPVAAYVSIAGLLFVASRWSRTVERESPIALALLDAPWIFAVGGQLSWSLLALVLVAGALTLSSGLAVLLVLEVTAMQVWLLVNSAAGPAETSVVGALLLVVLARAVRRFSSGGDVEPTPPAR